MCVWIAKNRQFFNINKLTEIHVILKLCFIIFVSSLSFGQLQCQQASNCCLKPRGPSIINKLQNEDIVWQGTPHSQLIKPSAVIMSVKISIAPTVSDRDSALFNYTVLLYVFQRWDCLLWWCCWIYIAPNSSVFDKSEAAVFFLHLTHPIY